MKKLFTFLLISFFIFDLQAQSKNLLPHTIISESDTIIFTYDEYNRFTEIVTKKRKETTVDKFVYTNLGSYEIIKSDEIQRMSTEITDKSRTTKQKSENKKEYIERLFEYKYAPQGKPGEIVITEINNGVEKFYSLSLKYDKNHNVTKVSSTSSDKLRSKSFMSIDNLVYDNKNGIFKGVNLTPFEVIYSDSNIIPYFLFLSNNVIKHGKGSKVNYTYNKDEYPILVNSTSSYIPNLKITYIEAVSRKVRLDIIDYDSDAFIGAIVNVPGTYIACVADLDGVAYLENLPQPCIIRISSYRYNTQFINYKEESYFKIKMEYDPYLH